MNRREFLGQAALAAASLSACSSLNARTTPDSPVARARTPKKVIVIGAGLAGLGAGYELTQAGHDVAILEARARPGGRVHTIREPFSDGLHAEAGALFIPNNHHLTLKYTNLFGLPVEPSPPPAATGLFYVRGRRIVATRGVNVEWPFDLTPDEAKLGLSGMWEKYVSAGLVGLGDVTAPGWPSDPRLEALDRMSASEFLRSRGASAGAVALLGVGYLDFIGDGIDSYSALLMLRRLALRRTEALRFAIRGGTDLLPRAFATRLAAQIRYQSSVVRIEPGETSASVVVRQDGRLQRLTADHVVWIGREGQRVTQMAESERILFALSQVERIFPGIRADFERGVSKSWDEDPWARGAFAYLRPGQMRSLLPHLARPEGRVHFAGEHTSPWSGWMQGALDSGLRAAREITDRA